MRYLLALICPPLALLLCRRRGQSLVCLILCFAALASMRWGIGVLLLFGCILWAFNVVGDDRAAAMSDRFIRTVKPIPMIRD